MCRRWGTRTIVVELIVRAASGDVVSKLVVGDELLGLSFYLMRRRRQVSSTASETNASTRQRRSTQTNGFGASRANSHNLVLNVGDVSCLGIDEEVEGEGLGDACARERKDELPTRRLAHFFANVLTSGSDDTPLESLSGHGVQASGLEWIEGKSEGEMGWPFEIPEYCEHDDVGRQEIRNNLHEHFSRFA
jgi:hypothetical protein